MGDIYVRGLDEKVKRQLMQEARSKGISLNKYILMLLEDHTSAPKVKAVEDKYSDLARDMMGLYSKIMERTGEMIEENTMVLMEVKRYLEDE